MTDLLQAQAVDINVGAGAAARNLVANLTLAFEPGEFVAVLGRNGCGKTLSMQTFAGLREPGSGAVLFAGVPLERLGRRAVAREVGLLTQDLEEGFVTTALETVLIGRHPHLSFWQRESAEDLRIANDSLRAVDLGDFASRHTDTLSGGELRRVSIAALLTQAPRVFLLDEPTNHLDPHHQLAVLQLFWNLTRRGATVIATLHDPTLAARFADRALLLFGDGRWQAGKAKEVLDSQRMSELYLTPMAQIEHTGRRIFVAA